MPNIPPKVNRRWKSTFSRVLYRSHNAIERMFCRLNNFRRVATRYDRLAVISWPRSISPRASATGYESGPYKMAMDWGADMANWSMFTPWPYSDLYREMEDKVEVFDFEKYNFVTPIMKPKNMDRGELLDAVMNNYRRFYMRRSLFHYPWIKDPLRRRYLLGCLKAFLKSAFQRKFYDLGKFGYWGPQTIKKLKWHFDASRKLDEKVDFGDVAAWKSRSVRKESEAEARMKAAEAELGLTRCEGTRSLSEAALGANACGGGGDQQMTDAEMDAALRRAREHAATASPSAAAGHPQMTEDDQSAAQKH